MELKAYHDMVATHLVSELEPILDIKEVTANTDLLGKYTEAAIRNLVLRIVQPMRICTGAVLDYPMPSPLRQIDIIIWAPFPIPALFDVEGFGLVPKSSAFGVIEVKRSNYHGTDSRLEQFLADVDARKIVDVDAGKPVPDSGGALADKSKNSPGLGILCVLDSKPSKKLQALIDAERVIAIFDKTDGTTQVRPRDVFILVNFLHYVTWRYRVQGSGPKYPQLNTKPLEEP